MRVAARFAMDTDLHFQHGFYNETTVNALGIWILVFLALAVFIMPRRWALVPMLLLCCFVAPGQRVVIATVDFTFLRLITIVGWLRVWLMGEHRGLRLNAMDWVVIGWAAAEAILGTAVPGRFATIYFAGTAFDALSMYFLVRVWIRGWGDVVAFVSTMCVLAVPVSVAFIHEHLTGHNPFSAFGGVPELTDIRDGRLRCQGAFAHPILAGCFWAALMPMMVAMWFRRGGKLLSAAGLVGSIVIIIQCASSTPVAAAAAGVMAWSLLPVRRQFKFLGWMVALGLMALQAAMSSPLWHLLGRIDLAGGSTGWHRFRLIDQWIRHWQQWAYIGSRSNPGDWGTGLFDVTNYYIVQGLHGGLLELGLFIGMLYVGFRCVGRLWRHWDDHRANRLMAWAMGISLFVHALNFIGVSYFGQITAMWYLLLGAIGSMEQDRREAEGAEEAELEAELQAELDEDEQEQLAGSELVGAET
jgi:hypothetical protein